MARTKFFFKEENNLRVSHRNSSFRWRNPDTAIAFGEFAEFALSEVRLELLG